MGKPIDKKIPKSTPIMSYGKKKMRPEYWFSVPRNRVDDLYNFLLLWVPHLYGELEDMDPKSRGYELVESDTELWEDESGDSGPGGKDERRASGEGEITELTRESWELRLTYGNGNGNINIGDLSFEEVEKFKYLGATVTNINDTQEEIKRRINMGNACYYSVESSYHPVCCQNLKVRIYKTVILPVVLYGCETWTLILREEHRLKVFENKVLRKIFGAKRDEVTGEWRKLHNTELHALYSSPDVIRNLKSRRLRWAGHVARMGESRNAYRVLVGRPEGKRPLGRPRRRWEDNIKMDLREVGYDDRDWINLAQDRD
ncbi:hypothetical protein ANN_25275 [Periplaneta americana]|uniref:Uncharacterized protein n=1 Tax=Periplaneta americana TaxID=6978 RepID=A0ABQ8S115_PERAM|nr:hypothetical protein ANN_25275 [Periplaneta americana]